MSQLSREREIFEQCLGLPPTKRWAFLENRCGRDDELKERIRKLLRAHESAQGSSSLNLDGPTEDFSGGLESSYFCRHCQNLIPDRGSESCAGCGRQRPARGWSSDPLLGKTVAGGQYRVIRRLGSGGFGVVYEVETVVGGLRRALKVLHEQWAREEGVRERFINEAVLVERINHPNVARCFSAGKLDDESELYLLFELIEGTPLSRIISPASGEAVRLEPVRAVRLARQVGSGLVAAHARGVLHRDLKPANVMVVGAGTDSEQVKLLDFGIAKFLTGNATWTAGLLGTPAYMAPEQFSTRFEIGPSVDIWQLGATLFTILTGRTPYDPQKNSIEAFMDAHRPLGEPGPSPGEVDESLNAHPALCSLVARLLSSSPDDRPASAAEVCERLARIEQSLSPASVSSRSALLDALCAKPSADSWVALSRYLEGQDQAVIQNAEERILDWPVELRRASLCWWEAERSDEEHPLWSLARTLDLSGRGIGDEEIRSIVKSAALESIRTLDLSDNLIGSEGVEAIVDSPHLKRLESLNLNRNRIGADGFVTLIRRGPKSLRVLEVAGNRIGKEGLTRLSESKLEFEKLDLSGNGFDAEAAEWFSQAALPRLKVLFLQDNPLGPDGVAVLSMASFPAGLRSLNLSRTSLGPAGAAALAVSKNFTRLRELLLSRNKLGREGLQLLLSSGSMDSIEVLDVASNGIGPNGVMALASSQLARRLEELDLSDNAMGDTGLAALLGAPQLTRLNALDVSQNELTSSSIALLDGSALQLQALGLSSNPLGEKGAEHLSSSMSSLRLKRLKVRDCEFGAGELKKILEGARGNLVSLDVSGSVLQQGDSTLLAQIRELASLRALILNAIKAERSELLALFMSPYLSNLQSLSLDSNRLGDDEIVELTRTSGLPRLEQLSLQDNRIARTGAATLATSALATHLCRLDLAFNQIGDAGAEALAGGKQWYQLQRINLRDNGIGYGGLAALLTAGGMGVLQSLSLMDNPLFGEVDVYNLDAERLRLVESSFAQISAQGTEFARRFYATLFERFPAVKPLFAHVSMNRQQQHLFSALVMIIENLRSPDMLSQSLLALGSRHSGYGVVPAHYDALSAALLDTIEECLGSTFSSELHEAWSEALGAICRVMIRAQMEAEGPFRKAEFGERPD